MKNGDKPAYPCSQSDHESGGYTGLTKREYFASVAMQGLLSNPEYIKDLMENARRNIIRDANAMAIRESFDMADELLKQLEQPK